MQLLSDNNYFYDFSLEFPLAKSAINTVESVREPMRIWTPLANGGNLYCPMTDTLVCFHLETLREKWRLSGCGARVKLSDDRLFTSIDEHVVCVDSSTAEILWKTEDKEEIDDVYGDFVYTTHLQTNYPTRCRNRASGELLWETQLQEAGQLVFSDEIFVSCGRIYEGVDIASGKCLWSFNKKEWIDRNILGAGLDYPDSLTDHERQMMHLGPLVRDTLYVMPVVGSIAAIDVASGELRASVVVPTGRIEMPYTSREIQRLVYHDGRLFFHRAGFKQKPSVIFGALDIESGDVIYTSEYFHPATGGQAGLSILVGRFYIVTFDANYLIVFDTDTDTEEIAWEYETTASEKNMFGGMPVPADNALIFNDNKRNLYRFQGKS